MPAPKQGSTDAEKEALKADKTADEICPDQPNMARQRDVNAGQTLKLDGKVRHCTGGPDGTPLPQVALRAFGC